MAEANAPRWSLDQLDAARLIALGVFVTGFGTEGTDPYKLKVEELAQTVRALFGATSGLSRFEDDLFVRHPELVNAARFLTAPPVSAANLKTVVGGSLDVQQPDPKQATTAVRLIGSILDPIRFAWLAESREHSPQERETAILWTASIWAIETMRTRRRNRSAKDQEALVRSRLGNAGFNEAKRKAIKAIEDLAPHSFSGSCNLGPRNCDVPIRLADGRLVAIECKVSSEEANSKKRLNNDVGAKADAWRQTFGSRVITAAVLSGVYALGDLRHAQEDQHITIFWSHDLDPLIEFVTSVH